MYSYRCALIFTKLLKKHLANKDDINAAMLAKWLWNKYFCFYVLITWVWVYDLHCRYLLRKLLQFQSVTDVAALTVNSECHPAPSKSSKSPVGSSAQDQTSDHPGKKTTKKKAAAPSTASSISEPRKKAQQSAKELLGMMVMMMMNRGWNDDDLFQLPALYLNYFFIQPIF